MVVVKAKAMKGTKALILKTDLLTSQKSFREEVKTI